MRNQKFIVNPLDNRSATDRKSFGRLWLAVVGAVFLSLVTQAYAGPVTGNFEEVSKQADGYYLKGWACDMYVAQSIAVHVYRSGAAGAGGTYLMGGAANISSEPGVSTACGTSGVAHRFSLKLDQANIASYKGQTLYVHGISTSGGANPAIAGSGNLTIPVTGPITGNFEEVLKYPDGYYLRGWVCDKNVPQSIGFHIYRNAAAGQGGTILDGGTANVSSEPAVSTNCGTTGVSHRFLWKLSQSYIASYHGQPLYVHGLSLSGGENYAIPGSGAIAVPTTGPVAGSLEAVSKEADGFYYIKGWACDKNVSESIQVHVYRNGPTAYGTLLTVATANVAVDSAASAACLTSGVAHRFKIKIDPNWVTQYPDQALYVYGISMSGFPNDTYIPDSGSTKIPKLNTAPTVNVTAPSANATYYMSSSVPVKVTAADDVRISKVELYINGAASPFDFRTTAPYDFTWTPPAVGAYSITAKAYDDQGLVTPSTPINITVKNGPIHGNFENVAKAGDGFYYMQGWACDKNVNQSIDVHVYRNGASGLGGTALFTTAVANVASEPAVSTACLTTNTAHRFKIKIDPSWITQYPNQTLYIHGISKSGGDNLPIPGSGTPRIPLPPNQPPTAVTINSPTANASFGRTTINLAATAQDSDGTISKIDYIISGAASAIVTSSTSPYSATWAPTVAGIYSVTARAYDNLGSFALSTPVAFSVAFGTDQTQYLKIESPADGSSYDVSASIPVRVSVNSTVPNYAVVDKIQLYFAGQKFGPLAPAIDQLNTHYINGVSSSYRYAAGSYQLEAESYDAQGIPIGKRSVANVTITDSSITPFLDSSFTEGSDYVGTIAGRASVTPLGGAAYTLPIVIPPGINGLAPQLALSYNSQSGNSWIGVGWSLSGLSSIYRCPRTAANDGANAPVNYDANDRFCLDGKRLVAVGVGAYGADGNEYRTEIDSFSRINSYGLQGTGPKWFKVQTKAGLTLEYGNTDDSRLEGNGRAASVAINWSLNKVTDLAGNSYTITYDKSAVTGEQLPKTIAYTTAAGITANNRVDFVYDTRTDTSPRYTSGVASSLTKRLSKIQVYAGGALVNEYRLAAATSTHTFRTGIASIQRCDATSCLPTIMFYGNGMTTPSNYSSVVFPLTSVAFNDARWSDINGWGSPKYYSTIQYPDMNNDGLPDVCAREISGIVCRLRSATDGTLKDSGFTYPWSDANGWGSDPKFYSTIRFLDLNRDGRPDMCGRSAAGIVCVLNTGSGFASEFSGPAWGDPQGWGDPKYYSTIQFADINGDGLPDVCGRAAGGMLCYLGTGSGFSSTAIAGPVFSDAQGWGDANYYRSIRLVDINGDSKTDMCARSSTGVWCYLSNGAGFGTAVAGPAWTDAAGWGGASIQYPDLNGDGMADICGKPVSGDLQCWLGNGSGFTNSFDVSNWNASPVGVWLSGVSPSISLMFADINGDGKSDVCGIPTQGSGFGCMISDGAKLQPFGPSDGSLYAKDFRCTYSSGTLQCPVPAAALFYADQTTQDAYTSTLQFVDIYGLGVPVLVGRGPSGLLAALSMVSYNRDLLAQVKEGDGDTISIAYRSAAARNLETGALYPLLDIAPPLITVSQLTATDVSTKFDFGGLRTSLDGRGLAGFRWMRQCPYSGPCSLSVFSQDFPYTGMVKQSQLQSQQCGGSSCASPSQYPLLTDVNNTLDKKTPYTGVYAPYVKSTTIKKWEQ